ncbi:MAG: peptide chain release factor N(5)-glutamine methyltransferase [Gemmatimonadaceae bacterium]
MDSIAGAAASLADRPQSDERGVSDGRTVGELMTALAATLNGAGIDNARTEARDIVAAVLGEPRHWPLAHRDSIVDGESAQAALDATDRRAGGAPFAYAVGQAAFRTLILHVDERVLIPRPETEQLVELVLSSTRAVRRGTAIDVGTGSGAIALSLASEGTFDHVIGTDLSSDALFVARCNGERMRGVLSASVEWRAGEGLSPVRHEQARVVVSNPPYIALGECTTLPRGVRDWEPPVALFGGTDGMSVITSIVTGAADVLEGDGLLALEVDARRALEAAELVASDGRYVDVMVALDLTGRERFVLARRRR